MIGDRQISDNLNIYENSNKCMDVCCNEQGTPLNALHVSSHLKPPIFLGCYNLCLIDEEPGHREKVSCLTSHSWQRAETDLAKLAHLTPTYSQRWVLGGQHQWRMPYIECGKCLCWNFYHARALGVRVLTETVGSKTSTLATRSRLHLSGNPRGHLMKI